MTEIAQLADIMITTEEDTERVFGMKALSYEAVAEQLAKRFSLQHVAITLRETPTVWRNQWTAIVFEASTGTIHRAPTFDIEVVDRVGSGDAFAGGFLYGILRHGAAQAVRYGVAMSTLKQTHPGDVCLGTLEEVKRLLDGGGLRIAR